MLQINRNVTIRLFLQFFAWYFLFFVHIEIPLHHISWIRCWSASTYDICFAHELNDRRKFGVYYSSRTGSSQAVAIITSAMSLSITKHFLFTSTSQRSKPVRVRSEVSLEIHLATTATCSSLTSLSGKQERYRHAPELSNWSLEDGRSYDAHMCPYIVSSCDL